jgi:cytochrome c-type biogenesis protein CcmH
VIVLVFTCAALAIAVMAAMFWPLLRGVSATPEVGQFDLAVYRDQLKELDRDIARGLLAPQEAAAARLEIQRRMLAPQRGQGANASASATPATAALLALFVIAGAGGLYAWIGAPFLPDQPAASRVAASLGDQKAPHVSMETAAAALKARLKDEPDNAERWLLYARTVSELGRWPDAIDAYQHVMKLAPDQPDIISAYGEMLVMAANGMVTPDARIAFTLTVKLDPKEQVARFYLALADLQAGEPKLAIDAWMKLAADAEDGSELRNEVVRRIADTAKQAGLPAPVPPPPAPAASKPAAASQAGSPDAAAVAAAANMTPEQRQAMIGGMVAQLAGKLEANPTDAEGWLKLGRAYLVMNEPDKSADAYDRAGKLRPADTSIPMQEVQALLDSRTPDAPVPQRAIALLRRVEAIDAKNPEALWLLGVASAQSNRPDDSQRYWQRLLDLLPPTGQDRKMVQDALDSLKPK